MNLDLNNPTHVDALRREAGRWIRFASSSGRAPAYALDAEMFASDECQSRPPTLAFRALRCPEQSAAIARALLQRCGVEVIRAYGSDTFLGPYIGVYAINESGEEEAFACDHSRAAALFLALLDATDRDSALAALRAHT